MGFLERSRSLRRKEPAFSRKKLEETPAAQPSKDIISEKEPQRPSRSAHSNREPTWKKSQPGKDRPRTAGKAPVRDLYSELPPPPSMEDLTDKPSFRLSNASRMSISQIPQTTPSMTFHGNHSTTGVALDSPRNPKRSFTSPCGVPQVQSKNKSSEVTLIQEPEISSAPSRKEPHLRKAKSGTWRSFFSRKQSKPPLPDFVPSDVAPALPKQSAKERTSIKSAPSGRASPVEQKPALPMKDAVRAAERKSISVDKTRAAQKPAQTRTKSMFNSAALPKLKIENLSALEPPSRNFARSPSAESGMTQFFDAASSPAPSPSEAPGQPRLDVSIPAVEMERYSIMFEKLLKPQPAIYERRQTMVKQLHLGIDKSGRLAPESPQLQRRATSPNLSCHTPVTAEMVVDSSQMATPVAIYRAGQAPRLLRSYTAPALTPSQSGFEKPEVAMSTANNSSACSTNSPVWSEASLPTTPSSDTETFVSFDLNDDSDDEAEIVTCNAVSLQAPAYKEHQWQIMTPKSAPPIPPKAPGRNSPPAVSRQSIIERPHPPRTSSLDDAGKRKTQTGPQIGIARKVSVVRRASPGGLRVPSAAPAQSPSINDPTTPISVFSKQPLRPKIVDVRNRKSTLVVLEEA